MYNTVDLLVLTSLDRLLLIMTTLFTILQKRVTLMRRSIELSLPLQLVFPAQRYNNFMCLACNKVVRLIQGNISTLARIFSSRL
jgi:hypothetical protein